MNSYFATVTQLKKMLGQVEGWIEKAHAFAQQKKFEPNNLLSARLAPDQYPLLQQLRATCDAAKFCAQRTTGKEAPKHPDNETTFEELRARIKSVISYLDGLTEKDFAGADEKLVVLPFIPGKAMRAQDYFVELGVPNFFFHVNHVYAILRHNGVDLGKMDYTGSLTLRDA
jgi:hypothetical protein